MFGLRKQTVFALGLAATGLLAAGSAARADWDVSNLDPFKGGSDANKFVNKVDKSATDFDRERLKQMSRDPRPGRDYTEIYLKNSTNQTISVAVDVRPFEVIPGNVTVMSDPDDSGWRVQAWYNLAPGERVHVANTANGIVYFYAEGKGLKWDGKAVCKDVRDGAKVRRLGFFEETFIGMPEEWTMTFNP
jgi:hypothetical protein